MSERERQTKEREKESKKINIYIYKIPEYKKLRNKVNDLVGKYFKSSHRVITI